MSDKPAPDPPALVPTQPLSKSAAKKAARAERYAATKPERRAKEKAAKRAKKQERALKRAAGELDPDDNAAEERARRKKRLRATTADGATHPFGGRIVLDLGFDDMMNDKEISSLCSQLAYTYSVNRAAAFPFRLLYTGLSGRTFARLERMSDAGYKRWTHTEWWHDGYDRLWKEDPGVRESVVYLTADADEELAELDPGTTYIIGGICDHNRYKNLCLNKARDGPIRAARLPIGRYLAALSTRKVLTVNQVFEILIKWVELRDWAQALEHVVPKRKFQERVRGRAPKGGSDTKGDDDAKEEEDVEEDPDGEIVVKEAEQQINEGPESELVVEKDVGETVHAAEI